LAARASHHWLRGDFATGTWQLLVEPEDFGGCFSPTLCECAVMRPTPAEMVETGILMV
jgi:hypothetical protein